MHFCHALSNAIIQITMELEFVPFIKGDYDQLITIWEKAGLPYKPHGRDSREKIEAEVRRDCNLFLFAKSGEDYIGAVLVTHDGRKGWINRVAVLPDFQKMGIGKKLVVAGESWLENQGIDMFACQIESYNSESLEAFQKMGYIPFEGMHYLTKRKYPEV